jgi:hypothetical protein
MENQSSGKGTLIGNTAIIWAFATGMLAICIPLVSMTGSGLILPLAVILGAGVGTAVVWLSTIQQLQKMNELTNTIQTLEQRVMNLETIGRGDKLDLQPKLETEA